MTQIQADDFKATSHVSVTSNECSDAENLIEHRPKAPCATHGPSQVPLLDQELQKRHVSEIVKVLVTALGDINDDTKCTKCTVENASALLTAQFRDIKAAKRNGEWSKEDKKAIKSQVKAVFKPVKKDIKRLWKEGRD